MCREEAASIYLDVLLGFRSGYGDFREAMEALTENDKAVLQNAVSARPEGARIGRVVQGGFFGEVE